MNILFITPYIPYPLDAGGKISQFAFLNYLRNYHKISVILCYFNEKDLKTIAELKGRLPNIEFHIIPGPSSLVYTNDISEGNESQYLEHNDPYFNRLGLPKDKTFVDQLGAIVFAGDYQIIQVDFIDFIDLVALFPTHIMKIFVHHEIRFARLDTYIASRKQQHPGFFEKYILNLVEKTEVNLLNQFDAVFTFSEYDKTKLLGAGITSEVYVSPFPVPDFEFRNPDKNFIPSKFIFIGGDSHSPNIDAIEWYHTEINEQVVRLTGMNLYVLGNWTEENKLRLQSKNIVFDGFVDDISVYSRDSIMVVPIRIGSGVRAKILHAMALGIPVISTSYGCQGLPVDSNRHLLIADSPGEIAEAAMFLVNNPASAADMILIAHQLIKEKFSEEALGSLRNSFYHNIIHQKKLLQNDTIPGIINNEK